MSKRADDDLRARERTKLHLYAAAYGACCFGVGVLVTLIWR